MLPLSTISSGPPISEQYGAFYTLNTLRRFERLQDNVKVLDLFIIDWWLRQAILETTNFCTSSRHFYLLLGNAPMLDQNTPGALPQYP